MRFTLQGSRIPVAPRDFWRYEETAGEPASRKLVVIEHKAADVRRAQSTAAHYARIVLTGEMAGSPLKTRTASSAAIRRTLPIDSSE